MSELITHLQQVKTLSCKLLELTEQRRNAVLMDLACRLRQQWEIILVANQIDLAQMQLTDPNYDRLLLTKPRILALADAVEQVAAMASPVQQVLAERVLVNGLHLQKISVPFGVVAVIYEARPNVTIDVFALCFKAANGVILRGGSEAYASNQALVALIQQSLQQLDVSPASIYLLPPERKLVFELLAARGLIDVCIPRGSQQLIEFVREHAKIPFIETGAGIVHTYFDRSGDIKIAPAIINNAKTRRVSVCNALDSLLVHVERLAELPQLVAQLADQQVILYADPRSLAVLEGNYPAELLQAAQVDSFGCEFLDYKLALKVVDSSSAAIEHILQHTSGHSEAIIAEDSQVIAQFCAQVDAAVIYINTSTAFTDGGEFGMGAEIGISTQKLHARGPMALTELTSYKWIVSGKGQIR